VQIRSRPLLPKDVRKCVEIVSTHEVLGPRYGDTLRYLPDAILSLIGRDALTAPVFEALEGNTTRILGAAICTFVTDDFLREIKTPPLAWATPLLLRRMEQGNSPVLSDEDVLGANSTSGLNLYVWHSGLTVEHIRAPEIASMLLPEFVRHFRGYHLKELLQQTESLEHFHGMRMAGGLRVSPLDGTYQDFWETDPVDPYEPQLVGVNEEMSDLLRGSALTELFNFKAPILGFTRSEQRLLNCALEGGTDQELSDRLFISQSAIKKAWRSAYERVDAFGLATIPKNPKYHEGRIERGREKKRHLLAYLREHPEELRPFSNRIRSTTSPTS
jgi:DNA-binding CsgD family transcriptional regulator